MLTLIWWAWSAFVWATNAQVTTSPALRTALLAAMVPVFLVGLAVPHAFGDDGALFAFAYAAVRILHIGLYVVASRSGNASWSAIAGFTVTVAVALALLVSGSFLPATE